MKKLIAKSPNTYRVLETDGNTMPFAVLTHQTGLLDILKINTEMGINYKKGQSRQNQTHKKNSPTSKKKIEITQHFFRT